MPPADTITQDNPAPHTPPTTSGSHSPKSSFGSSFSKLSFPKKFSRQHLLIFAAAFALIGAFFIFRSFAATQESGSLEAERMTRPAGTELVSDSNASGGQAILLRSNGTATSNLLSLSNPATQLTIRAKGAQCSGAPQMLLTIDGQLVQSTPTPVPATIWSNYTVPVNLASGSHTMSLDFNNDYVEYKGGSGKIKCSRDLYVDKFTFYRDDGTVVTPAPTVTLTADPTTVTSGATSTLTWSSTNATACTASGSWTGTKAISGSEPTAAITANSTYGLSCTGAGGTTAKSVTVTVGGTANTSIYWGSLLDGDETYASYYGNPAPNGQNWGDAPWANTGNTWDRFESNAGKKVSLLHYGQPNPWLQTTFYGGVADIITNRGAIPFLSMASGSTSLATVAAGTYDTQIKTWAGNVKAWGKPLFLRWNWEMNGNWTNFPWNTSATSATDYVNSWRHFHDVVVSQGATNITWVWCPNINYINEANARYPGDSYVDWTCLDGYNKDVSSTSFYNLYKASYDNLLALAPSKPIIIGEIGSLDVYGSTGKSNWITDLLNTQLPSNFPQVKGLVWFNWRINDKGPNGVTEPQGFPIESSASAQSAFAAGIASPYYASNNFGALPPLTKVQPLP